MTFSIERVKKTLLIYTIFYFLHETYSYTYFFEALGHGKVATALIRLNKENLIFSKI